MMWYWGGSVPWWGWLVGCVSMIVFWALVIWAIWYVVTRFNGHGDAETPRRRPEEILDERFARGEIDVDEYRRARDEIGAHGSRLQGAGR